jgi:hypothetical protein
MSNFSLFSQIGMIVVAVTMLFTYIKPTYTNIQTTRDAIQTYTVEANKVKSVDDLLAAQTAKVDAISAADMTALKRYMPDEVDEVAVMKDIQAIFNALAIPLTSLTASVVKTVPPSDAETVDPLSPHSFTVVSSMSYEELKTLLRVLEVNNYLLQVDSLVATPAASGLIGVSIVLTTYSRTPTATAQNADSNSST